MIITLWRGFPVEAVAIMVVGIGQGLRAKLNVRKLRIHLRLDEIRQTWMSKYAVAVVATRSDGHDAVHWCFVDELPAAHWARLRRQLVLHTPRKPWGLSISR